MLLVTYIPSLSYILWCHSICPFESFCALLCIPSRLACIDVFHINRLPGLLARGTDRKKGGVKVFLPSFCSRWYLEQRLTYPLALFPSLDRNPMIAPSSLVDSAPELRDSTPSFSSCRTVVSQLRLHCESLGGFSFRFFYHLCHPLLVLHSLCFEYSV